MTTAGARKTWQNRQRVLAFEHAPIAAFPRRKPPQNVGYMPRSHLHRRLVGIRDTMEACFSGW